MSSVIKEPWFPHFSERCQVAILFAELPKFLHLLPASVPQSSLELELNREDPVTTV
jgi:hypothetical protein